jgi:hypothetical protein
MISNPFLYLVVVEDSQAVVNGSVDIIDLIKSCLGSELSK